MSLQAGSLAAVAAFVVVGVVLGPTIQAGLSTAYSPVEGSTGALAAIVRGVTAIGGVAGPLWRVLLEPIWGYLFVISLIMGTSCAALGAALSRVTLGAVR